MQSAIKLGVVGVALTFALSAASPAFSADKRGGEAGRREPVKVEPVKREPVKQERRQEPKQERRQPVKSERR